MWDPFWKRFIGLVLLFTLLTIPMHPLVKEYVQLPQTLSLVGTGEDIHVDEETTAVISQTTANPLIVTSNNIPIKKIANQPRERISVVPGGHSVGIQVQTEGVIIVGFHRMGRQTKDEQSSPAYESGIRLGDALIELAGKEINSTKDVQKVMEAYEKDTIHAKVKRHGIEHEMDIQLIDQKGENQLGVYVKDKATGIGTLSFYLPNTGQYGALGHIISDNDTKLPIPLREGTLVRSSVKSIEKGNKGLPGEKHASFVMTDDPIGMIDTISPYGIYGKLEPNKLIKSNYNQPIPIAFYDEIEKGPAEIYTVIDGEKVEAFTVEILQAKSQDHRATKGIIIKVTDEALLNKTGGIVQGMSGSPIVQNGKMIGAVTHVFVNDPTSGYGVQIEWMLEELGIYPEKDKETFAKAG